MQVTDELRVLVEAEVARAIENFKKLSDGVEDSEKKTASLGETLDSISKKSMIVSGVLGGAGIAAVKLAGENEKLKLSLKNITSSAEEASVVFEEWRKLGSSPGLNTDEIFSLGKAMVNMGHSTEYASSTMKMLGNIAAGTDVSFGEISGSFEHVRAVGNLATRDLVSLQQKGIPIVKQLAKEMGMSEESIRQLAAEGKIGFADLERAFRAMTNPGGQFAGMMDELSGTVLEKFSTAADDAKQALASFGELLLPLAADLLDSASSILNGINNMEEGTKRFVLGLTGVVAASGPAIMAIKGIGSAIKFLTANPVTAIAGIAAGAISLPIFIFNDLGKKMNEAAENYEASLKSMEKSNQSLIKNGSFEEARSQIRGLTRDMYDAAESTGNFAAASEAASRLTVLNQQLLNIRNQSAQSSTELARQAHTLINILEEPLNPNTTAWFEGYATEIEKINDALDMFNLSGYDNLEKFLMGTHGWGEAVASRSSDNMLQVLKNMNFASPSAQAEINRIQNEINEITSGLTILPLNERSSSVPSTAVMSAAKKSWQQWLGEITKIDPASFGNSGARAAELYVENFERSLAAQTTIADALENQFDISKILRSRQSDMQNALVELFSIDPEQINRPFSLLQPEIQKIIEEYQRLGEEINNIEAEQMIVAKQADFNRTIEDLTKKINDLGKSERELSFEAELARLGLEAQSNEALELAQNMNKLSVAGTLEELSREVQNLGKDQYDLALAKMADADATEEEIKHAEELIEVLRRCGQSIEELMARNVSDGLLNIFPELEKQAAEAVGNIASQLAMISFDNILNGLSAVGELFAKGADGVDDFKQAMAQMAQQVLNQLPNMFLQAGLQLIAQGQWPMGLAFVAAAGSSAIIGGFVKGTTEKAAANAHGNAFDANGIVPYAHGGSFTNQIVNSPTYFRHGGKLGVMGEAGPESIMPLRRMANGDLGVASSGTGAQVTVNVINNTNNAVHKEEHTDSYGNKQIDVIIEQAVDKYITSGKSDRAMSRYGVRPTGV